MAALVELHLAPTAGIWNESDVEKCIDLISAGRSRAYFSRDDFVRFFSIATPRSERCRQANAKKMDHKEQRGTQALSTEEKEWVAMDFALNFAYYYKHVNADEKDEIRDIFVTIQLSERKKRLARKMANEAQDAARQAELDLLTETKRLRADDALPQLTADERRALHISIQKAEKMFTEQCFLFAKREEEARDVESGLKELTKIHADLLTEVDCMERDLVEYPGARMARELNTEYVSIGARSSKVLWAELSAMKAKLPSMMTPAERLRRKYKKGQDTLEKKEREWIILDRILNPRIYEWEERTVYAELQRAIANTRNEFMDSAVLHTTVQRFPTKVLRLELEKELDRLLMGQINEREQYELKTFLASKKSASTVNQSRSERRTGEVSVSESDSDEEAQIAREQNAQRKAKEDARSGPRDKVRGKTLKQKTIQKQRREIKDIWDKHIRLRAVDEEFHSTFRTGETHFETKALHGFAQVQLTEKVQIALQREHNLLVAQLTSHEVVEDILEYMLEGWVFGERESQRVALGFVPSLKRDGPLTMHDLRRLEQERRVLEAKETLTVEENIQGIPLEKWKPIEVAAFEVNESRKAVKQGSALDKQLTETEQALRFGIFCMTLMYFRGLSLIKKQKATWSTSTQKNIVTRPGASTSPRHVMRLRMEVEAKNVESRERKKQLYEDKVKLGQARRQKVHDQRVAIYRRRMVQEHQKVKRERHAAIQIQRMYRGHMGRKAGRRWMIRRREIDAQRALDNAAAVTLQRAYRGRLGRIKAEERRIELAEFISQIRAEEAIAEEEEYWRKHRIERIARQVAAFVKKQA
ncbi:hypothetical protein ATCC90586_009254 [Pythium insidiosum]|nr:hypothetical protein ATCC90586_009254 [Pythium insidiosum]